MSDQIDMGRFLERLRRLLVDCEREMQPPSGWSLHIHLTAICSPHDGGGSVSFTVSTEPMDDE